MKKQELLQIAYDRDFDRLEEAWMIEIDPLPEDPEMLTKVLKWLIKVHETDRAEILLAMLVEAYEEQYPGTPALNTAAQALDWFPGNGEFRQVYARQFAIVHADNPAIKEIINKSGLTSGADLAEALHTIEKRLPLKPGNYAIHRMRRIPVRIKSYDPEKDTLELNDGDRVFASNLVTYNDQYDRLADTDFRAQRIFEPEVLADLAVKDPCRVIKNYLRVCGKESTFRGFKDTFSGSIVETAAWKEWWAETKVKLVRDPYIQLGTGAQPSLKLRDTPRDFSEELKRSFDHAVKAYEQPAALIHYLNEIEQGVPADPAVLSHFITHLTEGLLNGGAFSLASWLALMVAAEAGKSDKPEYSPEWLKEENAFNEFVMWCCWEPLLIYPCVTYLPGTDPAWPEYFSRTLPRMPFAMVERAAVLLENETKPSLFQPLQEAMEHPGTETAEAFAWTWKRLAKGEKLPFTYDTGLFDATIILFELISQTCNGHEDDEHNLPGTVSVLRQAVSANRYALIKAVFGKISGKHAAELYQAVTTNPGVSTIMRSQLVQLLANQ
jgi:hypothetical protein